MNRKFILYLLVFLLATTGCIYLYLFYIPQKIEISRDWYTKDQPVNTELDSLPTFTYSTENQESEKTFNVCIAYKTTSRNPFHNCELINSELI